jgi:hypothetical protein
VRVMQCALSRRLLCAFIVYLCTTLTLSATRAQSLGSREQLAIAEFAQALLVIPKVS